jgi:hypothetical protein
MLSMTVCSKGDIISGSSVTLCIYGGYSDVKSTRIAFKCVEGEIVYNSKITYWKPGRTPEKEHGPVPESLYVNLWNRITESGVWQLEGAKYAGEDFPTYEISVSMGKKVNSFKVQNPSEQEERRYFEIAKEVIGLYNTLRDDN